MTTLRLSESQLRATEGAKQTHAKLKRKGSLGSGIFTFGIGRKKGREAKPEKVIQPTAAMPTPERHAMARNGWKMDEKTGGQVSYEEVRSVDLLKSRVSDHHWQLMKMMVDDYEAAQAVKVSSRPYTGAPYAAAIGADRAIINQGKKANRSDFMARHMSGRVDFWWNTIRTLVLGAHYARLGRPLSPAEIASLMCNEKDAKALATGGDIIVRLTMLRAEEAYHAWIETQPMKIIEPQSDEMQQMQAERELIKRLARPRATARVDAT